MEKNISTVKKLMIGGSFACLVVLFLLTISLGAESATVCSGGTCSYVSCQQNSDCGTNHWTGGASCRGNSVFRDYITYTCNNPSSADAYCSSSIATKRQVTCSFSQICRYARCVDDPNTTDAPTNQQSYSNHSYTQCVGNFIYWFDSDNDRQDLYQVCAAGQTCSGNACTTGNSTSNNANVPYTSHSFRACFGNISYWYDSRGNQQDVYQNCSLNSQTCSNGDCLSQIYQGSNGSTISAKKLAISIFGQKGEDPLQWSKALRVSANDRINFLIVVKNVSDSELKDVVVTVDLSNSISYESNLSVDNLSTNGNIVSGINLGSIPADSSKIITFSGLAEAQNEAKDNIKIASNSSSGNFSGKDYLTVSIDKASEGNASNEDSSNQNIYAFENSSGVAGAAASESFLARILKRWYVWIAVIIALAFLFVIVFRSLSKKV